jgi:hypothetical protein
LGLAGLYFREQVGGDGHEDGFGGGEDFAGSVRELGFDVIAAAGGSGVLGGKGEGLAEGDGAEIVDVEAAGHGEDAAGAIDFAHRLVEKGGDDASVSMTGRTGETRGEAEVGNDVVVGIDEEFEAQAGAVFESAAEAVVEAPWARGVRVFSWRVAVGMCVGSG